MPSIYKMEKAKRQFDESRRLPRKVCQYTELHGLSLAYTKHHDLGGTEVSQRIEGHHRTREKKISRV